MVPVAIPLLIFIEQQNINIRIYHIKFRIKFIYIDMSHSKRRATYNPLKAELEVYTKKDFNFKRNNSMQMSTCLSWNACFDQQDQVLEENQRFDNQLGSSSPEQGNQINDHRLETRKQIKDNASRAGEKGLAKTLPKKNPHQKPKPKNDYSKWEKTAEQIEQEKIKETQRRQTIKNYIQSLVPYSRTLTNSKFQQFYQKSAPQVYGAANTTQPVGGIVYGNNLRTFNVNPHDYQNNPINYQSYSTALNFAGRTKRNEEKHWKRLEKELGKKLNLHEKNHTLEEGKQVVYIDVNDENMYNTMRQNLEFKKDHRQEIRDSQKQFEHQKQMKLKAEKQKFLREKTEKVSKALEATNASQKDAGGQRNQNRIREQAIYKHYDKDGNVRIGADRHALTCFVDINFPQNDPLYTEQLKNRLSIYPTPVQERHKEIDAKRRSNFEKSLSGIYPSHYLVQCSEQPQIRKMLVEKQRKMSAYSKSSKIRR